jgi:hypothetical protein
MRSRRVMSLASAMETAALAAMTAAVSAGCGGGGWRLPPSFGTGAALHFHFTLMALLNAQES